MPIIPSATDQAKALATTALCLWLGIVDRIMIKNCVISGPRSEEAIGGQFECALSDHKGAQGDLLRRMAQEQQAGSEDDDDCRQEVGLLLLQIKSSLNCGSR